MADFIVITILIIVALLIIRKLYRDYKKYGDIMVGETVKCPNCGSNLKIENNKQKVMHCEYCGASVLIKGLEKV